MKKKFATAMFTISTAFGFAQDATIQHFPSKLDVTLYKSEEKLPKNAFTYVRTEVAPLAAAGCVPGIGIGYRISSASSALDFSTGYSGGRSEDGDGAAWTFPKINYFQYLSSKEDNSVYAGGGIALGGIMTESENTYSHFHGLIANATLGYEMHRTERFRSFVQVDVNQPTVASHKSGSFPAPWAALSVGAGF